MKIMLCVVIAICVANTFAITYGADPTRPSGYKASNKVEKVQPLRVTMTQGKGKSYSAVVAGKIVKEGDKVRGFKVKAITANTVTLTAHDEKQPLTLKLTKDIKDKK